MNRVRKIPVEYKTVRFGVRKPKPGPGYWDTIADGKPRYTSYLDFFCDGCKQFAYQRSKEYTKRKKGETGTERANRRSWNQRNFDSHHHHKSLFKYKGGWFGSIDEIKGRAPRELEKLKKWILDRERTANKIINDSRANSTELATLNLGQFYQWMQNNPHNGNYASECNCRDSSYNGNGDWIYKHPEVENKNMPGWFYTGWFHPGSYFNDYRDEALMVSNWEGVTETLIEQYPGYFEVCSGYLIMLLPTISTDYFHMDDYFRVNPLKGESEESKERAERYAEEMDQSDWFMALRALWDYHDRYSDYPVLFEDDMSQREYKAIVDSFDDYQKREVERSVLANYPELGEFDLDEVRTLYRSMEEGELPDDEDLLDIMHIRPVFLFTDREYDVPKYNQKLDGETLLWRLYDLSASEHGELYWDESYAKKLTKKDQEGYHYERKSKVEEIWSELAGYSVIDEEKKAEYDRMVAAGEQGVPGTASYKYPDYYIHMHHPLPQETTPLEMYLAFVKEQEQNLKSQTTAEMVAAGQAYLPGLDPSIG